MGVLDAAYCVAKSCPLIFFWNFQPFSGKLECWAVFSFAEPVTRSAKVPEPASPNWIAEHVAELLDRHGARLELYAAQWSLAPADCVQEAFVQLARLLQQSGTLPEHSTAWLYRVVRNQALNAARSARRRAHHEQIAALLRERHPRQGLPVGEQVALAEALDLLPGDAREVVVLRIWSELTWQEIAELTDTSSSSAQRRYVAALESLKKLLEPSCLPNPLCPPN